MNRNVPSPTQWIGKVSVGGLRVPVPHRAGETTLNWAQKIHSLRTKQRQKTRRTLRV